MLLPYALALALLLTALAGCTTARESEPQRTATEQLLISTAADRAVARLDLGIPAGTRVWVDAENFESYDQKYAIGAIRDRLLRQGVLLVGDRKEADDVVEIRSGALSIDRQDFLIGVPSFTLPIPLAGVTQTPEIALFKREQQNGVAKIGVTVYGAEGGALRSYSLDAPLYGFSDHTRWVVLLLASWTTSNILPEDDEDLPTDTWRAPELPHLRLSE